MGVGLTALKAIIPKAYYLWMRKRANELPRASSCPTVSLSYLYRILKTLLSVQMESGATGTFYFSLDERFLVQECGHYLIYGSEYICAIAAGLQGTKGADYDYQQHLRRNGRPTVFVCHLPIDRITLSDRKVLVAALVDEIASDPSFKRSRSSLCDFSFFLKSKLEPHRILEHRYPRTIPDPLRQMIPYRWAPEKSNSN